MKKIIVLLFSILLLTGCTDINEDIDPNRDIVAEFNENSNFILPLLTSEEDIDMTEYKKIEGFGGYSLVDIDNDDSAMYLYENETTEYIVSGYPDVLDEYFITYIVTTDPAIDVYGYSVGDTIDSDTLIERFENESFTVNNTVETMFKFELSNLSIIIRTEDNVITVIQVRIEATNNEDVVF